MGIEFLNPSLTQKMRFFPRIWNYFNFFFGYSGLWLLLIFAFAFWKKNPVYFGLGIVGLVLNSGLFIFAIIADGRFSLYTLIVGQLLTLDFLVNKIALYPKLRQLLNSRRRRHLY
jgi:hypothetical protein